MVMPVPYEEIHCKSVLGNVGVLNTRFWTKHCFDPYTNCELNCVYCSTSTCRHEGKRGFSVPIYAKTDAPPRLAQELARLKRKGVVSIGLAMDAYQPAERKFGLTRQVLEVLRDQGCAFAIGTKSDLVLRDLDVIVEASKKAPCLVSLSITTLDEELAKLIEPNASPPKRRLAALKKLSDSGVTVGVWLSPILPFLTDTDENIGAVVEAAVANGAKYVLGGSLDMRSPVGMQKFLKAHFPHLVPKYEALYRRGDGTYQYYPTESYLYELYIRFARQCRKHGVESYMVHFHTRKQAMLFYIHNFGLGKGSLSEFVPVLNYLPPTQEILQMLNLRFRGQPFCRGLLKTLRYFPH
jgi:DNA repair photolyase